MTALKIALTSDLYLPVTAENRLRDMITEMAAASPDLVVIAGDLAESLTDFSRVLTLFREKLTCPIHVLPGDVDCWARPPYDSNQLWKQLLPEAVKKAGCTWLEGLAIQHGPIAVAGSLAWYDYSTALMAGIVSELEFAQQKYLYSADALRIDWEWSDPEFASEIGIRLLATLDSLEQDEGVQQIVVVTHFPILEQQIVRQPKMSFASAYAGNLTLGNRVLTYPKVSHIVSAHTHTAHKGILQRQPPLSAVEYHVLPGDYEKPGWIELHLET